MLRGLIKSPGFTLATVFCLALGIGANSAIFSVIRGVLLRELPFTEPDELVLLRSYDVRVGPPEALSRVSRGAAYLDGLDWFASRSLDDVALADVSDYRMLGAALPEQVAGSRVTPNLFALLGATAELGRVFGPGESRAVVVLSHVLWQRSFGGSPDVIGKVIRLNDLPFEIVAVMPPSFRVPPVYGELWLPIDAVPLNAAARYHRALRIGEFVAIGRLAPGSNATQAEVELGPLTTRIHRENPPPPADCAFGCSGDPPTLEWGVQAVPLQEHLVGPVRPTLIMLMGAVTLLLIISSVNVTGLMVARLTARHHALAVHAALGAGRWRVSFQLLTESIVLSLLGGASGLWLALGLVRVIKV
ncbi:MAG: ABC transporter permease, partial [Candidatus Rokuibacteriota bacterium]